MYKKPILPGKKAGILQKQWTELRKIMYILIVEKSFSFLLEKISKDENSFQISSVIIICTNQKTPRWLFEGFDSINTKHLLENEKVTGKIWMEKVQMHDKISKIYLKNIIIEKA